LKRLNALNEHRLKPGRLLALKDVDAAEELKPRAAKRLSCGNSDLFNEKDYEQSLAELTEFRSRPAGGSDKESRTEN